MKILNTDFNFEWNGITITPPLQPQAAGIPYFLMESAKTTWKVVSSRPVKLKVTKWAQYFWNGSWEKDQLNCEADIVEGLLFTIVGTQNDCWGNPEYVSIHYSYIRMDSSFINTRHSGSENAPFGIENHCIINPYNNETLNSFSVTVIDWGHYGEWYKFNLSDEE